MPEHEKHCQDSFRMYGKRFDELHTWMDEPWEIMGTDHRKYRHDPYATPEEARELFGEYADEACLDHILLDYRESPKGFDSGSIQHFLRTSSKGKVQIDARTTGKLLVQQKLAEQRRKETEVIVACIIGFVLFLAGLLIRPPTSLFQQPSGISALPSLIFMISGFAIMLSTAAYSHHYSNERKKLMKKLE